MHFKAASDCSLLVRLGSEVEIETNRQVLELFRTLQAAQLPGVTSFSPSYAALMVRFDAARTDHSSLELAIVQAVEYNTDVDVLPAQSHILPVCYAEEFAPDLPEIADRTGLSVSDVIDLHTSHAWTVYFLGFLPGFAYMGDLPEALRLPRRSNPRPEVPAGSVAIAGRNTAVYPFSSAGGWNLVGRCPLKLFDHRWKQPSLLAPGDEVRFQPISRAEFARIAGQSA